MNETMAFPFIVAVIVGTAILSSIVTTMLPMLPNYWQAIKTRIKRVFTRKTYFQREDVNHLKEIVKANTKHIAEMEMELNNIADLQQQVNTLAEKIATRDKHRAGNIRRAVREYLEELKNEK